ncbi:hypothetical protein OlV7_007c [Ostreococcus lucimarinus virus 7]|uniref:hypothetical protein n=1 Tax=Ostreococcus lucimarinus virus 7 TaxID=1663209 RepID=UPI0006CF9F46|nr:hypothetical protein AP054_gp007 [Ostreococcus lucimarinus virus 7]ALI95639.1 hypothetical protein OlV7_007c [Ostreococcus lucimarinus virus 7]
MSERPRRNPKPIQRIENEQARNAEAAAARAAARPKTAKPRTAKPKINNIQPQNKRNLSPKNAQSRVLAILDSLSQGKNDKIYNMLYSIYRDAASTLFTRLELDDNALIASIEEQYKVVSDNIRQAGGAKNTLSLNFKTSDDKLNFCLLMWLDMSHDGTVGTNFETFVKSSIVKTFLGKTIPYNKDTEMMSRMKGLGIITTEKTKKGVGKLKGLWPGSQFENKIKVNLPYIFGVKEPITTIAVSTKLSNSAKNRDNKPIYVTIDSESEYKSISTLIENAKYPFTTSNGRKITRYYLKPIITISNRVDPGRLMPIKGVTEEFSKLMQKADKLKSTQLYNVKDCDFKVGKTRLTLGTAGRGKFNLKINGSEVPYGVTAGEAKKASNDKDKLSKFLGDFMQILTVLSKPVNQRIVLGTLDGVLCGMYCFLSKSLMNEEPRIFIDMSFKQRNQIVMYGVSDLIQVGKNVKPQVSTVGSNFISNNNNSTEVSSGSNRTEGGGNSNNRGFFGRIFGGNKKPANSGVVNKKPVNNGVRRMNVNNTASVAGSSSGSVSRNNNNNNVTSNNRRGQKRVRNNNANVNQPPAKKINVMRNRLIQNLKKKNLPNFVINGLVKSYDNKQKTANQIIREANNFSKTFTMGKTAQRIGTLRKR